MAEIEDLLLADVAVPGGRLRPLDSDRVELLCASISEVGLQAPIAVYTSGDSSKSLLICGHHRLEACRRLGLEMITARVYPDITEREARLIEIDENLVRHELNPLDRAASLAERKRIYEELHPEAKRGAAGGRARKKDQTAIFAVSFTKEAETKTGLSERAVRRAISIFSSLDPDVRKRLAGSKIAEKEGELFKLSKMPAKDQRKAVELILGDKPQAGTVSAAVSLLEGKRPKAVKPAEAEYQKLVDAWERAGKPARKRFLAHLQKAGVTLLGGPAR